jgi:hypothetical protein
VGRATNEKLGKCEFLHRFYFVDISFERKQAYLVFSVTFKINIGQSSYTIFVSLNIGFQPSQCLISIFHAIFSTTYLYIKMTIPRQVWWYTPIISEARGLRVQGQPGLHKETLSQKEKKTIP